MKTRSTGMDVVSRSPRWTARRRVVQILAALFYLILPMVHLMGFRGIAGNLASLKVGSVDLVEPAAGLSAGLAAGGFAWKLVLGMAPVVLLALVLGPVFCSWICPWGLLSEMLDRWRYRGRRWQDDSWRRYRWIRLAVFGVLVVSSVLLVSPVMATLSAPRLVSQLPLEVIYLKVLSPVTLALLALLLAVELLAPRRVWCRALCPVGSLASYLRTPRTVTVNFDDTQCLCPTVAKCQDRCPWAIDPRRMKTFDGCTNCLACIDVCPSGSLVAGWNAR